jgi:arabinose-5-phosphate isomerase
MEDIQKIIDTEAKAIQNIPVTSAFQNAIELIYEQVHNKGGKLITSGMGKAGQIAHNISTTFSSTGTPAVFLHPSEAQHGDLGILRNNDIMLLISNSGKTREILELIALKENLVPGTKTIVITANPDSELGKLADEVISTGNPPEVCPLDLSPTTSTTTMTVIGDILVVLLMKKIGFSKEEYAKRHHGGYLGEKSRMK